MKTYLAKIDHEMLLRTSIVYVGVDKFLALGMADVLDEHSKRNFYIEVWDNGKCIGGYYWNTFQQEMVYSFKRRSTYERR